MHPLRMKIVHLLTQHPFKPGALAKKLGVSRQALHRHLRILLEEKRIQKHGAGPHIVYDAVSHGITNTRVQKDFLFYKEQLLPQYLDAFAAFLGGYMQRLRKRKEESGARGTKNFAFLLDAAAVYSSNIEGNTLDLNSFLNSRMSPRKHRPKEAQEIEDLVSAYAYAGKSGLTEDHVLHAHAILSRNFVARSRQGVYRQEPVGVFSRQGLEYMAVEPHLVPQEMHAVFTLVSQLLKKQHTPAECFFFAAWLHLMIALIHPFSDGNGRTARLCEKWFLAALLGQRIFALPSEEQYWNNRSLYYAALKLGAHYWKTDMSKAFPFFALLPQALMHPQSTL